MAFSQLTCPTALQNGNGGQNLRAGQASGCMASLSSCFPVSGPVTKKLPFVMNHVG